MSCCFFHLSQSLFRRIQEEGLQVRYNDPDDRTLKEYTHMILSLCFVPLADVVSNFEMLLAACPPKLLPVMEYFDRTYVRGRPAATRGRRQRMLPPRYEPAMWNHYEAARNKEHKTNNISEGWHNRFRIVVGKHHPDLYSCLTEFQKEQAYSETCISELALGSE